MADFTVTVEEIQGDVDQEGALLALPAAALGDFTDGETLGARVVEVVPGLVLMAISREPAEFTAVVEELMGDADSDTHLLSVQKNTLNGAQVGQTLPAVTLEHNGQHILLVQLT